MKATDLMIGDLVRQKHSGLKLQVSEIRPPYILAECEDGQFHEDTIETLKREIKEEIGRNVVSYKLFDVITYNLIWKMTNDTIEDLHHFGILYRVKTKGKLKTTPDGIDSGGCKWYEINKLHKDEYKFMLNNNFEILYYPYLLPLKI